MSNFKLYTSLHRNKIIATITPSDSVSTEFEYYFYLIKDSKIIRESSVWSGDRKQEFDDLEYGKYKVQGFLRLPNSSSEYKISAPIIITELRGEYKNFLDIPINISNEKLLKFQPSYPYSDIACISFNGNLVDLSSIQNDFDIQVFNNQGLGTTLIIGSSDLPNGITTAFSGIAKTDSKLVFGSNDLFRAPSVDDIGNFSYISLDRNRIDIGNDYFGISKLYYYFNAGYFVVANSYHLLLILLKKIGLSLEFNSKKCIANFECMDIQPLYQNFSHDMDVLHTHCLPCDMFIRIENTNLKFEEKPLRTVFSEVDSMEIDLNYEDLLNKASEEIVENINIISFSLFRID
jgi:hypothetical protein